MAGQAYADFIDAVRGYLQRTDSTEPKDGKSNKEILQDVLRSIESGELNISLGEGTMVSYLSRAANQDETSGIVSGSNGYYLETPTMLPEVKVADEQKVTSGKGKTATIREQDFYPLMELWLNKKGYAAKDTSNLKSDGRWGNPDIIGVERVDLFGAVEIDVGSCEVKLGEDGWEQVIFESISHKRFANRSWFCHRVPDDEVPLKKGMEYYAERYRVGLVQIILTDAELVELKSGSKKPLDYIERVVERVPALYDHVPLREQKDVIERAGIVLTMSF